MILPDDVATLDDKMLRLAHSVRRRYGLPRQVTRDLKQSGWVAYLENPAPVTELSSPTWGACYYAMTKMAEVERNGYRLNQHNKRDGQRYLQGVDMSVFPHRDNVEARAIARLDLKRVVAVCVVQHPSYIVALKSFKEQVEYNALLNARRTMLRRLLKTKRLM